MKTNQIPSLFVRVAGALLVLAAGAIHLWLYFDYFHRVHVIGVLFIVNAGVAAVIGLALLFSSHPLVFVAGIAYAAGTLGAFFLSVYNGLFGYTERLRGSWQWSAGLVEAAAIIVLLLALAARRLGRRARSQTATFTASYEGAEASRIREAHHR